MKAYTRKDGWREGVAWFRGKDNENQNQNLYTSHSMIIKKKLMAVYLTKSDYANYEELWEKGESGWCGNRLPCTKPTGSVYS